MNQTDKKSLRNYPKDKRNWGFWMSTGFGSGLIHPAPGTWGSLAGLCIAIVFIEVAQFSWLSLLLLTVIYSLLAVRKIDELEAASDSHDAGEIVADEFAGMWVTLLPMLFLRPMNAEPYVYYAIAFLLFRAFDIIKPWPIKQIDEKLGGGLGVMLDDIVAGMMAALVFAAIIYWGII